MTQQSQPSEHGESAELREFRAEMRAFMREEAPKSLLGTSPCGPFDGYWGGKLHPEVPADVLRWRDVTLARGLTAPTWPKAYGGAGLTFAHAKVLYDEMRELGLPRPVVGFGFAMIGPTLLQFGNEEQKLQHLPAICAGEIRWCQGYSEPNAGSDLANVQLACEPDGPDHYVLNGQKVWTSHADRSDWIFCLARTDRAAKKQKGITFILVDMRTEGVTPRKIELISGASPFCETFFENVRVPRSNVVGEVNAGWTVAKALLGHERSMIGQSIGRDPGSTQRELVKLARKHLDTPEGPLPDALQRDRVAAVSMEEAAFQLTLDRLAQARAAGGPGTESSIMKIVATELKQRRFEAGMALAGAQGLGWEGDAFDDEDLSYTREWLRSRANTIEGGSSEVQLNIIAKAVLGLPEVK
ncbi:MAG: acyl-CoA dehydrogenase family protein [Myxococcales bacterium]|nr:acyl-CoA dehydrogenase family protein [Myxococcales bacterium]